jgi:hypothetical protein
MTSASRLLNPALRLASPAFFVALAAFLGLGLGGLTEPAAAQSRNIATVAGPGSGERTTLSQIPQRVTDRVSLRAIGIRAPDSTRWALSVIGGDDVDSFAFRAAGSTFEPVRVERPDGAGPTTLHLEQRDFLTLARTSGAVIVIDGETAPIPASLRRDMKAVFEKVV